VILALFLLLFVLELGIPAPTHYLVQVVVVQ
jgi:hypothetical protein